MDTELIKTKVKRRELVFSNHGEEERMDENLHFCGYSEYMQKKVEYVYRHKGYYMVFQDVPAEVCLHCGTRYFDADEILAIEKRFFQIYSKQQKPKMTITVPVEVFG